LSLNPTAPNPPIGSFLSSNFGTYGGIGETLFLPEIAPAVFEFALCNLEF
jgi:hypothetical protein